MAIAEPTTSASPFAKFANHGEKLVGAYGGRLTRQQQNFDTKQPMFKPDGSPLKEEVIWLVVMPGTTAVIGDLSSPSTLNPGDEVRFAVAGYKWGQLIDQIKNLPAGGGIKAGQRASGDVIEITLSGWSAETKNPTAAQAAGFTVIDGRIVLRSQEDKDRYVLAQSKNGGNTNPAKDYTITVRRPTPADAEWEGKADALFSSKPWENNGSGTAPATAEAIDDEEPF
jgi:hypothetical protein